MDIWSEPYSTKHQNCPDRKSLYSRIIGRSENPGVPVLFGGHILLKSPRPVSYVNFLDGYIKTTWTRWGGGGQKCLFLSTLMAWKLSTLGAGGQKNDKKKGPRSCWMPLSYAKNRRAFLDHRVSLAMQGCSEIKLILKIMFLNPYLYVTQ